MSLKGNTDASTSKSSTSSLYEKTNVAHDSVKVDISGTKKQA